MTLAEYAKKINKLVKKNPDAQVFYPIDDEGNDFYPVIYSPSIGKIEEDYFITDAEGNICCIN